MLSYLKWYLRKPFEFIGLLEEPEHELTEYEKELLRHYRDFFKKDVVVYKARQGYVTQVDNNAVELAHRVVYQLKNDTDIFSVGDYVKWEEYSSPDGVAVRDGSVVRVEVKVGTKTVFGTITSIDTGGEYKIHCGVSFYLAKVQCHAQYRPMLSDSVNLECTYQQPEDDQEEFDPIPSLLRVVRVIPFGDKVITGKITGWDPSTYTGIINDSVVFDQDVCVQLSPSVGASVVCNCVKGEYKGGYTLRAYNVTENKCPVSSKRHFFVVEPIPEFEVVLGDTKVVELCVFNNSDRSAVTVNMIDFYQQTPNRKVDVRHSMSLPYPIVQGSKASWPIEVRGERIGRQKITVVWTIKGKRDPIKSMIVYRTVDPNPGPQQQSRRPAIIVPGKRRIRNPVYRRVPMREYPITDRLREICSDGSRQDLFDMQIALNAEKPVMAESLSAQNYGEVMHTLLFLEEVAEDERYKRLACRGALYRVREGVVFNFDVDSEYSKVVCGDKVRAKKPWEEVQYDGVVWGISSTQLSLKFNQAFESGMPSAAQFDLEFVMNRRLHQRRHQAVDLVLLNHGADWLFPNNHCPTDDQAEISLDAISWFNTGLNFEQKTAIKNILLKKNLPHPYIIYGPPGTGKTVTVVEAILQITTREPNYRILVAAPTNSAVDTLALRLLQHAVFNKDEMIRLSSYNSYISGQIAAQLMDVSMVPSLSDPSQETPIPQGENIPTLYLDEFGNFKIMIGTLTTLSHLNLVGLPKGYFTHIVIDEAGQCHEPDTLMPIALMAPGKTQLVLAGDPQQLGPNVTSLLAKRYSFDASFLDRLTRAYIYRKKTSDFRATLGYDPTLITKLVMNYRSLPKIVHVVGDLFYGNDLRPTINLMDSREAKVLKKLVIREVSLKEQMDSMLFINVSTADEQVEGNTSWMNLGEVAQVFLVLTTLYASGVSPDDIGVITPYSLQKKKIYEHLDNVGAYSPKVASVEEFQGQERDVVILSLVRNNLGATKRLSEFVTDQHRVNVALSRARILNIIIGNRNTLIANSLWADIISRCRVVKAVSYPDPD